MTTTEPHTSISPLLAAAASGDELAWRDLIARFHRLVWSTARACGLSEADAADVTQTTWMRLAEQLGRITEPEPLPGWLVTTTRREAARVARRERRPLPSALLGTLDIDDEHTALERLVRAERRAELRVAFRRLGERCRVLLALMSADGPVSYADISLQVEIPVGSIGPTRRRCLTKLARLLGHHRDDVAVVASGETHEPG
jgi:RNA polymerase sigma factor (sigma-70 family)